MSGDPIGPTLASFAAGWPVTDIPAEVRERAKLHLLDAIGCGLAAVGEGAGSHATAIAAEQGGIPEAALLGSEVRGPAAIAALANGTRCHALDFDDTHERGICHSSTVVGPAALAVGEASSSSGEEILAAYILGSEIALRIATASAEGLYARGFHPTSVCGAFGATAAASRLLGLSPDQTTNALGIVGSFAGGLFEYLSDGSATKPIHAGWAAQAGVQAARLAAAGATGPATVIEGRFGLLASHTGSNAGAGSILEELGTRWETLEISIKPFPACHFAHAPTWAAGQLVDEQALELDEIVEIVVRIPAEGAPLVLDPPAAKAEPQTAYDAKFSLPFSVAHRLLHGHLDVASFSDQRIGEPEIRALAHRVRGEVIADSPSRFAGGARLITASGEQFDRFLAHAPGSPANPLDREWVLSKFRSNADLSLESGLVPELLQELRALDQAPSGHRIGALLSASRGDRAR